MTGPASGRLLALIAGDLPGYRAVTRPDGIAVFVPEGEIGPELLVESRLKRRFLGRTESARFQMIVPAPGRSRARLRVRQTGPFRRRGVEVRVVEGAEDTADLALALASDPTLGSAAARLDFTRFDIELDGGECTTTIELMGASIVAIALPPIRSYVRLHADQRDAMIRCLEALERAITR